MANQFKCMHNSTATNAVPANGGQPMNAYFAQQYNAWARTGKKKYEIWAALPYYGRKIQNFLEDSTCIVSPDKPVVLSGTMGEQWTVTIQKLASTYLFATGEMITQDSLIRRLAQSPDGWLKVATTPGQMTNYAMFLDKNKYKNIPITTNWGEILIANRQGVKHGDGDYLVCGMMQDGSPNFNDMWVVNGTIFPATYNVQNFSLSPKAKQMATADAPRPEPVTNAEAIYAFFNARKIKDFFAFRGISALANGGGTKEQMEYINKSNMPHRAIATNKSDSFLIVFKDATYCMVVLNEKGQCANVIPGGNIKASCGAEMAKFLSTLNVPV